MVLQTYTYVHIFISMHACMHANINCISSHAIYYLGGLDVDACSHSSGPCPCLQDRKRGDLYLRGLEGVEVLMRNFAKKRNVITTE